MSVALATVYNLLLLFAIAIFSADEKTLENCYLILSYFKKLASPASTFLDLDPQTSHRIIICDAFSAP